MTTPIVDFVKNYIDSGTLRLHMPGHKGVPMLGPEPLDITEIPGADWLYDPHGIIRESEKNAGRLFGADTFYSAEGSSLCVRAMLYLAALDAERKGKKPIIAAGRNVHKSFLTGAALLGAQIIWIYPKDGRSYLSCTPTSEDVEAAFRSSEDVPAAVYLTSPDYLGNTVANMAEIAEVCHRHGALLLIDNAHGAYLRFLNPSCHPMDMGADMCCDSAHKTLPVLTGGAYLHISPSADELLHENARHALGMFGTTSPSYLILQSLDLANRYLETCPPRLAALSEKTAELKGRLRERGFDLRGDEPLKITLCPKSYGYTGDELGEILRERGMVCEFSDPDHLVLMVTPESGDETLARVEEALVNIIRRDAITETPPELRPPVKAMSLREACFSPWETVPVEKAVGRILAGIDIACPPAVPIAVCGEVIDESAARCMRYYGVTECRVVK